MRKVIFWLAAVTIWLAGSLGCALLSNIAGEAFRPVLSILFGGAWTLGIMALGYLAYEKWVMEP